MKRPIIKCRCCKGTGKVLMDDALWEVLELLKDGLEASAEYARHKLGGHVGATAYNNRLEALRKLGFITRRRLGRKWQYKIKTQEGAREG